MEDRAGRASDHVVTAAWLYYHEDQTQQQIAKRLGVSRATVVRLLQTAREDGLVEIRVTQPLPTPLAAALELEELLSDTSVQRVVVAESSGKQAAATAAGRYLSGVVTAQDVLGVGWSTTLARIDGISNVGKPPQRVVQMVGSVGPASKADGYEIALRLARTWGVPVSTIPAPVIAADERTAQLLIEDPVIAEAVGWFDRCSLALIGVGTVSPESTMVDTGYLKAEDLHSISAAGAVGDVLGRYFDREGNVVATRWEERIIGATIEHLCAMRNVVIVAAGTDKVDATMGAIRSSVVNTLVVDSDLAGALCAAAVPGDDTDVSGYDPHRAMVKEAAEVALDALTTDLEDGK
jgi:DNA-binding transcriptional regulator LsrR (DeoR family)